jgi:hypothetical protein
MTQAQVKINIKPIGCKYINWTEMAQGRVQCPDNLMTMTNLRVIQLQERFCEMTVIRTSNKLHLTVKYSIRHSVPYRNTGGSVRLITDLSNYEVTLFKSNMKFWEELIPYFP